MKINSNIEEVIGRLKKLAQDAEAIDWADALTAGVNAALGKMKFRVFNTGRDSKQIAFGKYVGKRTRATNRKFKIKRLGDESENRKRKIKRKNLKEDAANDAFTEYEKIRLSEGRQIKYKDLEFHGSLRRGIQVVREGNKKVFATVINEQLIKIIDGQTRQISRITGTQVEIFSLSEEEREILINNTKIALSEIYARLFHT